MSLRSGLRFPKSRIQDIVVAELADEVVIYDERADKASCLNPTSAFLWKRCNGATSTRELAEALSGAFQVAVDEGVVHYALTQLEAANLMEPDVVLPGRAVPPPKVGLSRRTLLARMAVALIPVVLTLSVPRPAAASPQQEEGK
jgi:hypothetical protein